MNWRLNKGVYFAVFLKYAIIYILNMLNEIIMLSFLFSLFFQRHFSNRQNFSGASDLYAIFLSLRKVDNVHLRVTLADVFKITRQICPLLQTNENVMSTPLESPQ